VRGACSVGPATGWTSPAGHAAMGIVGTVDSAYKALRAAGAAIEGLAMPVAGRIALDSGALAVFSAMGPSAGVRRPAVCRRAAENASMQRGRRRCGTMGEERHEAQARAAAYAGGGGGRSIEAREERLDAERRGRDDGRLAERGARPIEGGARAAPVEAVAAHGLEPRLGQVREVAGEECVGGKRHHDRIT
jgi:hypothetical protein